MRKTRKLVTMSLSALLFPTLLAAFAPADSTESHWSYGKRRASYEITVRDLSSTGRWDPRYQPPPLSIARAIEVSKQQLALYDPEVPKWVLGTIQLESYYQPNLWYYVVSWRPASEEANHWLHIPVLMSGVAVKLTLEDPAPAKESR